MPLFRNKLSSKSQSEKHEKIINGSQHADANASDEMKNGNGRSHEEIESQKAPVTPNKSQLVFHCQLAHGSSTGLISGFSNVRELYQKIADCYEIPANEVIIPIYRYLFL